MYGWGQPTIKYLSPVHHHKLPSWNLFTTTEDASKWTDVCLVTTMPQLWPIPPSTSSQTSDLGAEEGRPHTAPRSGFLQPLWMTPPGVRGTDKLICSFTTGTSQTMLQKKKKICFQKIKRNLPIKELRNSLSDEKKCWHNANFNLRK